MMQLDQTHIYLDYNASTPTRPSVREAISDALALAGNPSSVHTAGRRAYHHLSIARQKIADLVTGMPDQVIFTSGGTESNFLAIHGAIAKSALKDPISHILVSATEHPCVLAAVEGAGIPFDIIPVDPQGVIDLEALKTQLSEIPGRCLLCVMMANNETGTIQPIAEIDALCSTAGALLHVDGVQAVGKIDLNTLGLGTCATGGGTAAGLVSLSLSAHKIGGPQGVGALIIRDGYTLSAIFSGGGQEQGRRSGTENVPGIIGFGVAAQIARQEQGAENDRVKELRDHFEASLLALLPDAVIFSDRAERLSNTSCFAIPGIDAEKALINLDLEGVCLSSGSACSSGKVTSSHVLRAMGVDDELSSCALRLSVGWGTTISDIEKLIEALQKTTQRLRKNAGTKEIA